jgi:hypothetical protein
MWLQDEQDRTQLSRIHYSSNEALLNPAFAWSDKETLTKNRKLGQWVTKFHFGLDSGGSRVRFPAEDGNFSFHHRVQNGSEAHPASYPMGTRGSFPGGKAAGAWS